MCFKECNITSYNSFQQEDCGGVSSGLWYDLMNKISVGITTFSPEMERNALNQAIKEYAQHQTILSPCMVCIGTFY